MRTRSLLPPLACLAAAASLAVPGYAQGVYDRGRALTRDLLAGDSAALEARLSPKFVESVGGSKGLASLTDKLRSQAGRELEVLEEYAFKESGFTSYYRVSRFERMPRVTTRWVWGEDGLAIGGTVTPSAEPAPSQHLDYRTRAALRLPMRRPAEGEWYVAWGGRDAIHNKHVQAPDQRFAYDLLVMRNGRHFRGDGTRNEDHLCFGEPVVAPAAGRVAAATDGEPDNPRPGAKTNKTAPGNHVVIDHGSGEHSLIAHLKMGSVTVKPGQRLAAGDLLGKCGNSGRSDLPHIHYHLQTAPAYGQGVGLPTFFNNYTVGGRIVERGEPRRGDLITP